MSEREPPHEQLPPEAAKLADVLNQRVEKLEARYGVTSSLIVYDAQGGEVISHNPHEPYFAASLAKLQIAAAVTQSTITPDTLVSLEGIRREGAGDFDNNSHVEATVAELYQDMLKKSGNAPAVALVKRVLGGYGRVNDFTRSTIGLTHTQLEPYGEGFDFGHTTPTDQAQLVRYLDQLDRESLRFEHPLALLGRATDSFGMRRHVSDKVKLFVKDGQYNNDDDDGMVRHDAGYAAAEDTRLLVVAMSRAPQGKRIKAKAAELWLGQVGTDIESYLLGKPYKIHEGLGGVALSALSRFR